MIGFADAQGQGERERAESEMTQGFVMNTWKSCH